MGGTEDKQEENSGKKDWEAIQGEENATTISCTICSPEENCGKKTEPQDDWSYVLAQYRAKVLQSTQWFFSEQQWSKQIGGKTQKVGNDTSKSPKTLTDLPGACQEKAEEKSSPGPTIAAKPVKNTGLLRSIGGWVGKKMQSNNASNHRNKTACDIIL